MWTKKENIENRKHNVNKNQICYLSKQDRRSSIIGKYSKIHSLKELQYFVERPPPILDVQGHVFQCHWLIFTSPTNGFIWHSGPFAI